MKVSIGSLETPIGMLTGVAQSILVVEELESICCGVLFLEKKKKKSTLHMEAFLL